MNQIKKRPEVVAATSSLDKSKPHKLSIPVHIIFENTESIFSKTSRTIIFQSSIGGLYDTPFL